MTIANRPEVNTWNTATNNAAASAQGYVPNAAPAAYGGPSDAISLSSEAGEIHDSHGDNPFASAFASSFGGGTHETGEALDTSGRHYNEIADGPKVAVCPECGSANCACLARITLQQRYDEEHAKLKESQSTQVVQAI